MIECIIGKIVAVLGDLNLIKSYYIIQIYQYFLIMNVFSGE